MKTIEVHYSSYIEVEVPDDWEPDTHEQKIIEMAIEQHEQNPDGYWEIVTEDEDE
jgi:hypothetical protein